MTNTSRLVQWHDAVLDAPGDSRSDLWFIYHLGKRLKQLYADSTEPRDAAIRALTWQYPERGDRAEPDAEAVLREINGYTVADRKQVPSYQDLKDDGSTACGGWMYCGIYPRDGHNVARSRTADAPGGPGSHLGWAFAWPSNRRTLVQPRLRGPGRATMVRAQEDDLVGRLRRQMDRHRRARLHPRSPPRLPPGLEQAPARHGRPGRRRPVHHGGGRQMPALRPHRPQGRPAPHPLRATGKPGQKPPLRPAVQPDHENLGTQRQRTARSRRPALPLRLHHLPPDRAALRRHHGPRRAAHGGVAA